MRTIGWIGCLVTAVVSMGIAAARDGFDGSRAGEQKTVAGMKLCWCPPGKFTIVIALQSSRDVDPIAL